MKALVIGYGSIGKRHAGVLKELECDVSVVSRRAVECNPCYGTLKDAVEKENPGYIVIANRTSEHLGTLSELLSIGFKGKVLVEKPLFSEEAEFSDATGQVYVAYNLRFHPIIQRLKSLLENERIISVQAYAGQYLPEWRPETDYRESYSADTAEGGGVLRDLSHELDYLNWMLGGWTRLTALGGHLSSLEIKSDDVCAIMMETRKCPAVTVQLNYLDRAARRQIIINTDGHTVEADLIKGRLSVDKEVEEFKVERNFTYLSEHKAVMDGDGKFLCTLDEGREVVAIIGAVERSIKSKQWVTR